MDDEKDGRELGGRNLKNASNRKKAPGRSLTSNGRSVKIPHEKRQYTIWTKKKEEVFLETMSLTGSATLSCKKAGLSLANVYTRKYRDPEFTTAWEKAYDLSIDRLEEEARRRAETGVNKPVFQGGEKVGVIREYSDSLMTFLLKGNRKKYRDRMEVAGKDGGPLKVELIHAVPRPDK